MWDFTAGNNAPPVQRTRTPGIRMPTPYPSASPSIASSAPIITTVVPPSRPASTFEPSYIRPPTPMSTHSHFPPQGPMLTPTMHSSHSISRSQTPAPQVPSVHPHTHHHSSRSRSRSRTPVPALTREAPSVLHHDQHRSRSRSRALDPAPVVTRDASVERREYYQQRSSSRSRRNSSPRRRPIIVVQPPNTNIIVVPQKFMNGKKLHHKSSSHGAIVINGNSQKPYTQYNDFSASSGIPQKLMQKVEQALNQQHSNFNTQNGRHKLAQQIQQGIGGFIKPYLHHHSHSNQLESYFPRPEHPAYNPFPHPNPSSTFEYSRCTGNKKALCIGINYYGQDKPLKGCVNDARHMREFLIRRWGFKAENIVLLTDDNSNPKNQPTKKNMFDAMKWLVKDACPHDSLFFHYSGHGSRQEDLDGDELDGYDETILPVDYKKRGVIIDDDLHSTMVKPLPPGCRLTALFDSCHSGTVLDLPYVYTPSGRLKGIHVSSRALQRKASRADVISWSGCQDDQTSADTFQDGVAVGAMSYAFISSLRKNQEQSYQDLLRSVREIVGEKFKQTPQLGSSHQIDTKLRFII